MKRGLLIFLLMVALCPTAGAQQRHLRRVPRLGFARLERNVLQFPGGKSPEFELFLRKLDTLVVTGRGDVRILHMGGSHVQGGNWSGELRRNFLSMRYGMDGGRGLVFPFAAAATNTPSTYRSSYTGEWSWSRCLKPEAVLGLTGMSVSTQDTTATVTIDLQETERRPWQARFSFRSVDVLGYGELEPVLLMDKDTLRTRGKSGVWHFELPHYTDFVRVGFLGFPGSFTLQGLYLDRPGGGFTLSEAGVNGAATASWLRCEDLSRDLTLVKPDLVIFSIGINDIQGPDFDRSYFVGNYRRLVEKVRAVNPQCAILFTVNNDSWYHRAPNRHTETVEQAFLELSARYKAALWDLYDIMGGHGSMQEWTAAGLAQGDKIHFTPDGYRLLGDLLFNAILQAWEP